MAKSVKLLQQLRGVVATVARAATDPLQKNLLMAADITLNELLLREESPYYLEHIEKGARLVQEGIALANRIQKAQHPYSGPRKDLSGELRHDVIREEILRLHHQLLPIADALKRSESPDAKQYLAKVSAWESGLYQRGSKQAAEGKIVEERSISAESVRVYLERKFPEWRGVEIKNFVAIQGGFSKQTYLVELQEHPAIELREFVIRAEPAVNLLYFPGSEVAREFPLIQLLDRSGIPVAQPLWLETDATHLGTKFLVSKKVSGEVYGDNFNKRRTLSEPLIDSIIATMAKMHRLRIDPSDPLAKASHIEEWLPHKTVHDALHHHVYEFLPTLIKRSDLDPSPQLQRALNWLQQNVPETDHPVALVHGDYALHNLLIEGDRISAVLDWETSRLGDPMVDISLLQRNFGLSLPEFMERYRAEGGLEITEYRMAYGKVAKRVARIIGCLSALRAIEKYDAPIKFNALAFKLIALEDESFNELIDAAESVRR